MEIFWEDDTTLKVNGELMTPSEALQRYPKHSKEINALLNSQEDLILAGHKDFFNTNKKSESVVQPKNKNSKLKDIAQEFANILGRKITRSQISSTTEKYADEISKEIDKIFLKLEIQEKRKYKQFDNAYKLFKYVVQNSQYDEHIMVEKSDFNINNSTMYDFEIQDIHKCLCQKRSVCTSDAAALSLMYRMIGIDSKHITIADKNDDNKHVHEVVLMNLNNHQYICDPTLTRMALKSHDIPAINESVFAFTPNDFFSYLYPASEVKFEHEPISLNSK